MGIFGFKKKSWKDQVIKAQRKQVPLIDSLSVPALISKHRIDMLRNKIRIPRGTPESDWIDAFYLGSIEFECRTNVVWKNGVDPSTLITLTSGVALYIDIKENDVASDEQWNKRREEYLNAYLDNKNRPFRQFGIDYAGSQSGGEGEAVWRLFVSVIKGESEKLNNS